MTNVASRKAAEAADRQGAWKRQYNYQREVVEPEVEELSAELFQILRKGPEGKNFSDWTEVTLTVDGRYNLMDPKHPYPEVAKRQYRFRTQRNYYDHEFYVHVETWRLVPNWSGHYNPRGSEKWDAVAGAWHKLQVLRALLKKEAWDCPTTLEGASTVLLRFMERQRDQMTDLEKAALICFQDSRRDDASRRPLVSDYFPNESEIDTYILLKDPQILLRPFSEAKARGQWVELKEIDSDRVWVVNQNEVQNLNAMQVVALFATGQV